jgi:hypothetical protein
MEAFYIVSFIQFLMFCIHPRRFCKSSARIKIPYRQASWTFLIGKAVPSLASRKEGAEVPAI